jgi:signal transduction histidine kinase
MAVLTLSSLAQEHPHVLEAIKALSDVHLQIADLIHTLPGTPAVIANGNLISAIRTMVQGEFATEFHAVSWQIQDNLSPLLDPLAYEIVYTAVREAIRNAAAHGRGQDAERKLGLVIEIKQVDWVIICIKDDGVGLSYQPPADGSLPSNRGSGSGLALHSTMMAIIGGYLTVETPVSGGTQVLITFPPTQAEPDEVASTASDPRVVS